jgi:uncharacterized repeat protein (TIGR03803 family)
MTHPRIASSKIAHSLGLKSTVRAGLILTTLILMVTMAATPTAAQNYTILYNFDGRTGAGPIGTLVQGRDGNLYGTARNVFRISTSGKLSVVHSFVDTGEGPRGITLGTDGNFYGTTISGSGRPSDYGTWYMITPGGKLTALHKLIGQFPIAPPIQGTNGNFYGATTSGLDAIHGIAYKMTRSGIFTVLGSLPGLYYISDPLIQATDGLFYGPYEYGGGGAPFSTALFKVAPDGVPTTFFDFGGVSGVSSTTQLVQGSDGNLYGITAPPSLTDGGVAYKLTPQGAYTVLHTFGWGDGAQTSLLEATDGNFYGYTSGGELFRLSPTGDYSVVRGPDSLWVLNPPMQHTNGKIYGVAYAGGTYDYGVVYSLDLGLPPFVSLVSTSGKVGTAITILGQGFTGTTSVSFNGTPATFKVWSDTFLKATVPSGATTGPVTVTAPTGTLTSNHPFRVHPVIHSVTPGTGAAGTPVVITGTSFTQTTKVTFGSGKATATFTVDSDTQVTATVPAGAPSGYIVLTTIGGRSRSPDPFTVTP